MSQLKLPTLHFRRVNRVAAYEVASWQYVGAQQRWNLSQEAATRMLAPEFGYTVALDPRGSIVGVLCSGQDARIKGGEYAAGTPRVLDVLARLRPSLHGRGMGQEFLTASFGWFAAEHSPRYLRTTITADNLIASKVLANLGFAVTWQFTAAGLEGDHKRQYLQLERVVLAQ